MHPRPFVLLVALSLTCGIGVQNVNGEQVINYRDYTPEVGDYLIYELVGNAYADLFGKSMDEENYLQAVDVDKSDVEYRITGEQELELDGSTIECFIEKYTLSINFTAVYFEDTQFADDDKYYFELEFETNKWIAKQDSEMVKKEDYVRALTSYIEDGNESTIETIIEDKIYYSNPEGAWPETLEVGSSWTVAVTEEDTSTTKIRWDGGDWSFPWGPTDTNRTVTTDYEVTGESKVTTSAGTFDTLKIQSTIQGASGYTVDYQNSEGLVVKRVMYENDEIIIMTMQIKDYRVNAIQGESDSLEDYLSSISLIATISVIGLIGVRRRH